MPNHNAPLLRQHTQSLVQHYRQQRGLSFHAFAQALNACLAPTQLSVSRQTIKNWHDGIYIPDFFFIVQLARLAPADSWQRAFAIELLPFYLYEKNENG